MQIQTAPTDRWGNPIDLPVDMLRLDPDGTYAVRCWCWDYIDAHGYLDGCEWAPDYPETRGEHPVGRIYWASVEQCFGRGRGKS